MNSYDINFEQIAPFSKTIDILENQGIKLKETVDNLKTKKEELIKNFIDKYQISSNNDYKKMRLARGFPLPKKNKLVELENISGQFTEKVNNIFLNFKSFKIEKLESIKLDVSNKIIDFCTKNKISEKILTLFLDLINLILDIINLILSSLDINSNTMINNNGFVKFDVTKKTIVIGFLTIVAIVGFLYLLISGETTGSILSLIIGVVGLITTLDISEFKNQMETKFDKLEEEIRNTNHVNERLQVITMFDLGKISEDSKNERLKTLEIKYKKS